MTVLTSKPVTKIEVKLAKENRFRITRNLIIVDEKALFHRINVYVDKLTKDVLTVLEEPPVILEITEEIKINPFSFEPYTIKSHKLHFSSLDHEY